MAKSVIKFKKNSMVVHDSFLEIILHFMIPEIKKNISQNLTNDEIHVWLSDLLEISELCEKGFFPGELAFDFGKRVTNNSFKNVMLRLIESVQEKIISKGKFILLEELNEVGAVVNGIDHPYEENMETEKLLFYINNIKLILEEKEPLLEN